MKELLHKLTMHHIDIDVAGENLQVKIPQEGNYDAILQEIRENKASLILFLKENFKKQKGLAIPVSPNKQYYRLSSMQRRFYFLYELDKLTLSYNMPELISLKGVLDRTLLETAFRKLIMRHEILRTSFILVDGEPFQQVANEFEFEIKEYQVKPGEQGELIDEFVRPFDLAKGPLLRMGLIDFGNNEYLLLVDMHHIIMDGVSQGILIRDFMSLYQGDSLDELPLQYRDYAEWQQSDARQERLKDQESFWLDVYQELPEALNLPLDQPRTVSRDQSGGRITFEIGLEETAGLRSLAEKSGGTMFMVLLGVYTVLLSRMCNQEDIVVGVPTAGRPHADVEDMLGMFVNTLALRNYPHGELRFIEFLTDVKERTLQYFDNQDYQYEDLIDRLKVERSLERNPLFDVMFAYEQAEELRLELPGLQLEGHHRDELVSKFDLTLTASENGGGLVLNLEYALDIFTEDTIKRIAGYYQRIVSAVTVNEEVLLCNIEMLSIEERQLLLVDFNGERVVYPKDKTIVDLFQEQVVCNPDLIAAIYKEKEVSYSELAGKVNGLVNVLRLNGLKKGDTVAIVIDHSMELLTALLAVMKCGCTFVPIDIKWPTDRQKLCIKTVEAKLVLCHKNNRPFKAKNLLAIAYNEIETIENIEKTPVDFEDSIYIIYTSGTTGVPKGVEVPYKGIMNRLFWMNDFFGTTAARAVIQTTRYVYDSAVWQFFWPLINGGKTIILPEDFEMTSDNFCQLIEQHQVSMIDFMPSIFNALFDYSSDLEDVANSKLNSLKYIIQGGEELSDKVTKRFIAHYSFIKLVNLYGPTEGSIGCIYYLINDKIVGKIPIGKPISNMFAWILDKYYNLLPVGAAGELYISGEGIAKGYVNAPIQTAERFIPNPFGSGHMYKTGDRVRRLPDGNIGFIGRVDNQVKIRGFRIELGEIEHQLSLHPGLNDVAVDCRERAGDKFLVAYYVSTKVISSNDLRDFLLVKLPEYMVPAYFVFLPALPLTAGGKVNKKLLPAPDLFSGLSYVPPSNEVEQALVEIWSEILQLPPVEISTKKSFFELGGHSLRAMILVNAISKKLRTTISLRDVFIHQDIRRLGAFILQQDEQVYLSIPKIPKQSFYQLSSAQNRLYFLYEFDRSALLYNMARIIRLTGAADRTLLETAFRKLIMRHEILRTSFMLVDGEPFQQVADEFEFEIKEYRVKPGEQGELIDEFVRPFDLAKGPLLRVGLINFGNNEYLLLVDMHHIIMDGVSQGILIRDFMSLYQGDSLNELPLQYRDYAEWQQSDARQERLKDQESFWLNVYQDLPEALNLPTDQARAVLREHTGGQVSFEIGLEETAGLRSLAEKSGGTMFMVLLGIYTVLLSRICNQEDIVVGVPTAGRPHADVEDMLGMFVNTLALRNYPHGELRFIEFLTDVKRRTLQYFDNQDYQYEDLIDRLKVERSLERNPLFDVMFAYEQAEGLRLELPGIQLEGYERDELVSKFDLTLTASENGGGLVLNLEYALDIFTEDTIKRITGYYQRIVSAVTVNEEVLLCDIEMLSAEELQLLLVNFNGERIVYPKDKTIVNLFQEQAKQYPERVAVVYDGKSLTYKELDERSNQIADYLIKSGIVEGEIAGICMKNSFLLISGILGVLKSGAAYTPIDPAYPAERINYIVKDSKLKFLIVDPDFKNQETALNIDCLVLDDSGSTLTAFSVEEIVRPFFADHLAYVIYTSGSTGDPKGAMINHSQIYNLIMGLQSILPVSRESRYLLGSSIMFDASVKGIFLPLTTGATLYLPKDLRDIEGLINELKIFEINVFHATPSLWSEIIRVIEAKSIHDLHLNCISSGGEVLTKDLANQLYSLFNQSIYNMYGPTETTVNATYNCINSLVSKNPGIGKPLPNYKVFLLNKNLNMVPVGIAGQIFIAGNGVGKGYINREKLTHLKFTPSPFSSEDVLYETGDSGRYLTDGTIEFLGRIDEQIKLYGIRIEPGEIETQLLKFPGLIKSVVVCKRKGNNAHLVAYYTAVKNIDHSDLRDFLGKQLPKHMMPSHFMALETIPVLPNGKVNRRIMPDFEIETSTDLILPSTLIEQKLLSIWSELLSLRKEQISIHDNFFEIGGHSILVIRLVSYLRKHWQTEITIREIFEQPTIKELSAVLSAKESGLFLSPVVPAQRKVLIPLSFSQERLWLIDKYKGSVAYHIPLLLKLSGQLDIAKLEYSFRKIIERHEVLRTTFQEKNGKPYQKINSSKKWNLSFTLKSIRTPDQFASKVVKEEIDKPFNLTADYMLRAHLVQVTDELHILAITVHHIAADGWSVSILLGELLELYDSEVTGRDAFLQDLPVQYADYSIWQKKHFTTALMKEKLIYWTKQLEGVSPVQLVGEKKYDQLIVKENSGKSLSFMINGDLQLKINKLIIKEGTTLFMFYLSVFKILLYRYTGQDDICIGSPVTNRTQKEIEPLIGFFLNSVALRTDLSGNPSFNRVLNKVRETTLSAYSHQEIPFEHVLSALNLERNFSDNPLFNVFFNVFKEEQEEKKNISGLSFEKYNLDTSNDSKFQLTLNISLTAQGTYGNIVFSDSLFTVKQMKRMLVHFKQLVKSAVHHPDQPISMLNYFSQNELNVQKDLLSAFLDD